jgi:hypothetical protein
MYLLKISNLELIEMVNQTIMPTNIGIPIIKTPRIRIGQRVITRSIIRVQIVGLMRLKIRRFFSKVLNQMLHPNMFKRFKQTQFPKENPI